MSWGERVHRVKEAYLRRTVQLDTPVSINEANQLFSPVDVTELINLADVEFCTSRPAHSGDPIYIYSQEWPLDSTGMPVWHQLLNGTDTASTPTFKVQYRNSEDLKDDVRINWELNRLTWLIPVAVHAKRTGNDEVKQYVVQALESFLNADRVGYSSRWSSSIELAMQSLSLVIVGSLIDVASTHAQLHSQLSGALVRRFEWIDRFPSKYSSANNHLLAELAALSVLSAVIPSLHSTHNKHLNNFLKTATAQFNDDGLNAELATDYHLYALDLLISVLYLGNEAHDKQLSSLIQKVAQATNDVVEFCGFWPRISDSDHAAVLSNVVPEQDRALWLSRFSEQLLNFTLNTPSKSSLSFKDSGYTFLKSVSDSGEVLLLADHGYLGFGDIAAHAHADSAAIWLWVNRKPVLVESGTYSYHSRDDLRDAFRSSMWHNTISINGASTSTPDGPFLWLKKKRATASLLSISDTGMQIEVKIPKSVALATEASHVRKITLNGDTVEVTDTVSATTPFTLASHLILAEEFNRVLNKDEGQIHLENTSGQGVKVSYDRAEINLEIDEIETSATYGKLEHSTRVTLNAKQALPMHVLKYSLSYNNVNN